MGIVLTVLEPPHQPEPNLMTALPPGVGRVIDVEPRVVSPRYDTLLVTTRGLIVRDHVSGDFSGVPWESFSVSDHLHQYNRHAILLLWLNERRPIEVAVTRRLALNIASVAPALKQHPTTPVDDVVLAEPPRVIELGSRPTIDAPAPQPTDRFAAIPPPELATPVGDHGGPSLGRRRPSSRLLVGAAVLVLAGALGGLASIIFNTDGSPAGGAVPMITSEAVAIDKSD